MRLVESLLSSKISLSAVILKPLTRWIIYDPISVEIPFVFSQLSVFKMSFNWLGAIHKVCPISLCCFARISMSFGTVVAAILNHVTNDDRSALNEEYSVVNRFNT